MTVDDTVPQFRVLLVCTANQCRSPMAQFVLQHAVTRLGLNWEIGSAGTRARTGAEMADATATVLIGAGFDVAGWRTRALSAELVDAADLVLTASVEHRTRVVTAQPAALARVFPLLQFARMAQRVDPLPDPHGPAAGDELVELVRAQRSHVQPALPGEDDIRDPIGRRSRAFRTCFDVIETAVAQVVSPLTTAAHRAPSVG